MTVEILAEDRRCRWRAPARRFLNVRGMYNQQKLMCNPINGLEALLDFVHGSSFVDSNKKYNGGCVTAVTVIWSSQSRGAVYCDFCLFFKRVRLNEFQ